MAKTAALCVLFVVMLAFAVQESEAIILKTIAVASLLKKLKGKKAAAVVPKAVVVPKAAAVVKKALPAAPVPVFEAPEAKPVFARVTAGKKPYYGEGRRLKL
eukprot:evm.model.scf_213EXC.7 EVM.evm.TU.scf_213EXC.7   scf_213EXC:74022-75090(+)